MRPMLVGGFLLLIGGVLFARFRQESGDAAVQIRPDPRLAVTMNCEPTPEEIARLEACVGCTSSEVIGRLGHPHHASESQRIGCHEEWCYYWGKPTESHPRPNARVCFKNGRAVEAEFSEGQAFFIVPQGYFPKDD